ncbi:hypothetical protein P8452_36644 [Trifolium repens]|nr:hypothetical protein P8452_36644 [Trifolium repens]
MQWLTSSTCSLQQTVPTDVQTIYGDIMAALQQPTNEHHHCRHLFIIQPNSFLYKLCQYNESLFYNDWRTILHGIRQRAGGSNRIR